MPGTAPGMGFYGSAQILEPRNRAQHQHANPMTAMSLALSSIIAAVAASLIATGPVAAASELDPQTRERLDAFLLQKQKYYNREFPDISFVNFEGGDETTGDLSTLHTLLGPEPSNLDYEHPPQLRQDLMDVSMTRLESMLLDRDPSATLFQADERLGWNDKLCVLTINPSVIAGSNAHATSHLLGLSHDDIEHIPDANCLHCQYYLEFVFDHETYHCLKSAYVGPQLLSDKALWAEYNHYRDENGADAFAMILHIARSGEITPFARNFARIRGLALYNLDPDHMTTAGLERVFALAASEIEGMDVHRAFALANAIRAQIAPDYEDYLRYLAASVRAAEMLGLSALIGGDIRELLAGVPVDEELAGSIATEARADHAALLRAQ
jgi:hypothetical protein